MKTKFLTLFLVTLFGVVGLSTAIEAKHHRKNKIYLNFGLGLAELFAPSEPEYYVIERYPQPVHVVPCYREPYPCCEEVIVRQRPHYRTSNFSFNVNTRIR